MTFFLLSTTTKVINGYSNNNNILEVLKACWRMGGIDKNAQFVSFRAWRSSHWKGFLQNNFGIQCSPMEDNWSVIISIRFPCKYILKNIANPVSSWSCVRTNPHTLSCAQIFAQSISMTRHIICRKNMQEVVCICVPYENSTLLNCTRFSAQVYMQVVLFLHVLWRCTIIKMTHG